MRTASPPESHPLRPDRHPQRRPRAQPARSPPHKPRRSPSAPLPPRQPARPPSPKQGAGAKEIDYRRLNAEQSSWPRTTRHRPTGSTSSACPLTPQDVPVYAQRTFCTNLFRDRTDRFGPSTTGLPTSVHRGAWWVKVDVLDRLRSGSAAPSRAIRSLDRIGCRFSSGSP